MTNAQVHPRSQQPGRGTADVTTDGQDGRAVARSTQQAADIVDAAKEAPLRFLRIVETLSIEPPNVPMMGTTRRATFFAVPYPRNPHLTGRADVLRRLEPAFAHTDLQRVIAQALQGLPGNGKTHLAVGYAYRHERGYAGSSRWPKCGRASSPWRPGRFATPPAFW